VAGPPDLGGFAHVDRAASPDAYADYLDAVRGVGAVADWKRRSFEQLRPRPGAALLDIGCGTGEDAVALARLVAPGGTVTGIDASAAMVAEARRRAAGHARVAFAVGDARHLGVPAGSVDGCRAERVLLHLDDPAEVVAEMARALRAGGRAVVAEPDWGTLVIDAPDPDAARAVAAAAATRFRSPYAGRSLRRLLLGAGLADVEVAARTLVITDPADAEALFGLADAARRAVDDGALTAERAAAWNEAVRTAGPDGGLLVAMTAFMAAGDAPRPA
jgi:SAM-dependent methyltransferase